MKLKLTLSAAACLLSMAAWAQYCPTQAGTTLKYSNIEELPEHVEQVITQTVDSIYTEGDRTVEIMTSKTVIPGSLKTIPDQKIKVYYTAGNPDATTEYLLLGPDELRDLVVTQVREEVEASGQVLSQSDLDQVMANIRPTGKLLLTLDPTAAADAKIPNASLRMSIATMNFSFHISNGKVLGRESIEVPAGTFADCLKITYIMKQTNPMETVKFYVTEWYAPEVGLVKQEMKDKKGNIASVQTLTAVERP